MGDIHHSSRAHLTSMQAPRYLHWNLLTPADTRLAVIVRPLDFVGLKQWESRLVDVDKKTPAFFRVCVRVCMCVQLSDGH